MPTATCPMPTSRASTRSSRPRSSCLECEADMAPKLSRLQTECVETLVDLVTEGFRNRREHIDIPYHISAQFTNEAMARGVRGEVVRRLRPEFPQARYGEYFGDFGFCNGVNGDGRGHPRPVEEASQPAPRLSGIFLGLAFRSALILLALTVL